MPDNNDPRKEKSAKVIQPKQEPSEKLSYFVATVGVSKLAVAPLERAKLLLQCQPELLRAGRIERPYEGLRDCLTRIAKYEGTFGLWRGNLAACNLQVLHTILHVVIREQVLPYMRPQADRSHLRNFSQNVLVGGLVGALSIGLVYPLDYARTRLANDVRMAELAVHHQFKGFSDVIRKTVDADGLPGLYRGFATACGGIILYRALYFGTFETLDFILTENGVNRRDAFLASYFAAIMAGLLVYPLDTVRRRMMLTSGERLGERSYRYKNMMDCLTTARELETRGALWRGLGVHMLAGVSGTFVLLILESLRKGSKKD